MRSSKTTTISLNQYQEDVLRRYSSNGLKHTDFFGRDWFNDYYHERAFSFLIDIKKLSVEKAFLVLDNLSKDQARGILQGLSHDEVSGLTREQIYAFLKYGLPKADLISLTGYQIEFLLVLKNDGIQSSHLYGKDFFDSKYHGIALLYLMRVKGMLFNDACEYLKDLTSNEENAISFGIEKSKVKGLENHLIAKLIDRKKTDGLQNREDLEGLDRHQVEMVERLYHFGLTSQIVKKQIKQTGSKFVNSFICLVLEKGMTIQEMLPLISGLSDFQVYGISAGLSRDEVIGLNHFHIKALVHCKTIKNELSAKHFLDKNWFDSEKHVDALTSMLSWGQFTVVEAMEELDGLTGDQAKQIAEGKKRDDIIGLTEFQLNALDKFELRWKGLTGSHLRGKNWFNSANHVTVLEHLVKKENVDIVEAINQLDGLNAKQIKLFFTENIKRDIIIKLTPIQIEILDNKYHYGFFGSTNDLLEATWLNTKEQAEFLKKINDVIHDSSQALAMVKYASDNSQVEAIVKKIENGEMNCEAIRKLVDASVTKKSVYASRNTLYNTSSITIGTALTQEEPSSNCRIM